MTTPKGGFLIVGGSMDDNLKRLVALQDIDKEVLAFKHEIERIEQELKDAESELSDDQQILDEKHKELMLYKQQRMDLNLDWETAKVELEKLKKMSLQVKTNKEYQDILRDIDHKKSEIDEMVEDILMQDEKIEKLEAEYRDIESELNKNKAGIDGLKNQLRDQIEINNEKIEALRIKIQDIKKSIPDRILRQYIRIQQGSNSGGIALVAILRDGTCGGCYGSLPIQKIVNIKESGSFGMCEMCGRLIYFSEE
jgi:uncharacterized protein